MYPLSDAHYCDKLITILLKNRKCTTMYNVGQMFSLRSGDESVLLYTCVFVYKPDLMYADEAYPLTLAKKERLALWVISVVTACICGRCFILDPWLDNI